MLHPSFGYTPKRLSLKTDVWLPQVVPVTNNLQTSNSMFCPRPVLVRENSCLELWPCFSSLGKPCLHYELKCDDIRLTNTTSLQLLFPRLTHSGDCPGTMDTLARRKAKNPLEQSEVHQSFISTRSQVLTSRKICQKRVIFTHILRVNHKAGILKPLEGVSKVALASPGCKAPWLCRPASTIEPIRLRRTSAFVPWGFSLEPIARSSAAGARADDQLLKRPLRLFPALGRHRRH